MQTSITYTTPTLCHYNYDLKKSWFIYFDVTNRNTRQVIRKQVRGGINFWKTKETRLKAARSVIAYWIERLENSWNPFEEVKPIVVEEDKPELMTLADALDFGLSKCKLASKTMAGYRGTVGFVKAAAVALDLAGKPMVDIRMANIKLILEKCIELYKWSNASYNKNLGYLKAILTRVEAWEIIENNPAHKIAMMPVVETEKYTPYTEEEKKAITKHLYVNHYRYYVFLMCLYQTGVRPKEILALKIKDLDLINNQILIKPDLTLENSKTKKIRRVPISNVLMPFFRELDLQSYSRECYLFGSTNEPGKGNCGSAVGGARGALHPDYFKPSFVRIKRDTVTKLWKKVVIDGLGIDKYLYSAKATGADDKIMAGIPLDALREMYGHQSAKMTERYVSVLKKVNALQIIEKSPGF
jgi:integrase